MNEVLLKRINDAGLVMKKIHEEGYDAHKGLIDEALEFFLLDVLEDSEILRLKNNMRIK